MHCAEMSILLHRALEARMTALMNLLSEPHWHLQPEGLHDVRVASRRVRAVLDLVDPDLYPGFKRQKMKLKGLTRALGRSREMDVHLAILEELGRQLPDLGGSPAMEHALEVVEVQRGKAVKAMTRDLAELNLKHLPQLLEVPSLPDPFREGDLAGAVWDCLARDLEAALPTPALRDHEDARALHLLRIRIKRLRYALEVLASAFLVPPEPQLAWLKELQTALGDHHDRVTLEAQLQSLHGGLRDRRRPLLAAGVLEILSQLGEERLIAFEQFRALALAGCGDSFAGGLRRGLGLEPEGDHQP